MNKQISIDWDAQHAKLLIRCPFWANDLLNDMPVRRWSKAQRAWMVPVTRKGVEFIRERIIKPGYAEVAKEATAAMKNLDRDMRTGHSAIGFPAWYRPKTDPRKHQIRALNRGYGLSAFGLFMATQTGKTKTAIDLCCCYRMEGEIVALVVICKCTLRDNWVVQFEKHAPIPYSAHTGSMQKLKAFERWLREKHDFPVLIVGIESLSQGKINTMVEEFIDHYKGKVGCVVDESSLISGHKATRSERVVSFGRMVKKRIALTATPSDEGPMNLFMQFEFLDPNIIGIGDFYAFRNRYAIMGGYHREDRAGRKIPTQIVGYQNLEELTKTIAPYVFQVKKEEAYDLPPKRYKTHTIDMTGPQRKLYDEVMKTSVIKRGSQEIVLKNVLGVALRLHQIAGGWTVKSRINEKGKEIFDPVRLVAAKSNPKLLECAGVVEEWGQKQGLLWCVYKPEIEDCAALLRSMGKRVGELHGGVPKGKRMPMVHAFERGEYDWLVGNASTGGMGYTMMTAQVGIFYNNTFKRIDRVQAEDRAYGDGQKNSLAIVDLVMGGSIDITIMEAQAQKQDLAQYLWDRIDDAIALLGGVTAGQAQRPRGTLPAVQESKR